MLRPHEPMNFLAHFVIATRSVTPVAPLPYYVAGNALPDLLPLASPRRLRLSHVTEGTALAAGVRVHLATDAAFHKAPSFADVQADADALLKRAGFSGIRVRAFFLSHVLVELALDAALLRTEPSLADLFYAEMAAADLLQVGRWTERVLGEPLSDMAAVVERFIQHRYLQRYLRDKGVADSLNRLCSRARQDVFTGGNMDKLTHVVAEAIGTVDAKRALLLAETAAGLHQPPTIAK